MTMTELIRELLIVTRHPRFWYWYSVVSLSGFGNTLLYSGLPTVLGYACAAITGSAWGAVAFYNADRFTKRLVLCACCTFGNHDIRCSCDGSGCCHPAAYLDYNPEWGHGTNSS